MQAIAFVRVVNLVKASKTIAAALMKQGFWQSDSQTDSSREGALQAGKPYALADQPCKQYSAAAGIARGSR
jgi:hypothetical protein